MKHIIKIGFTFLLPIIIGLVAAIVFQKKTRCIPERIFVSILVPDSTREINKILRSITDTLPEFKKVKPFIRREIAMTFLDWNDANHELNATFYPDGNCSSIIYKDLIKHTEKSKKYYPNGKLKLEETRLLYSDAQIGKSHYYSQTGTLDSIVDNDKKHKVNYSDVLKIVKQNGWNEKDVCINYLATEKFWQVMNNSTVTAQQYFYSPNILQIDANTGKKKFVNYITLDVIFNDSVTDGGTCEWQWNFGQDRLANNI